MSGPLAIAAVTAALKDLLNNGLLDHDLSVVGSFSVTSSPPDRITTGSEEPNRLNLFLYQVAANPGWRNVGMPARDAGGARVSNPPLALDLHYLLTAYGSEDLHAEILLGYAMQLLHETPVLSRDQLRTVLAAPDPVDGTLVPGIFGTLSALDLADQPELIKITPTFLGADDLSKMWAAMQARYRPSMAYCVSVVLIQATGAARAALPVLRRGADDRGPLASAAAFPILSSARAAASESLPAVRLGDDLIVRGANFGAPENIAAVLTNAAAGLEVELPVSTGSLAGSLLLHLPAPAEQPAMVNELAVGMLSLALRTGLPGASATGTLTNSVPVALAPLLTLTPPANPAGYVVGEPVTLHCRPRLQARQAALTQVIFGSQTVAAESIDTPAADLLAPTAVTFAVPPVASGAYVVRLRVEGIDSLPVTISGSPPVLAFDPAQKVTVS